MVSPKLLVACLSLVKGKGSTMVEEEVIGTEWFLVSAPRLIMIENPFFDLHYASIIPKSAESPIQDQSICLSSFENVRFKSKEWRRSAARILSNHPELSTWGLMNTVFQRKQVEINQYLLSIESFVKIISKPPSSSIIDKILIYVYISCVQIPPKLSPWEEKSHSY